MRKWRLAAVAALVVSGGSLSWPVAAHAGASSTFYVNGPSTKCSDATTDSTAIPYCSIQAAVDAATSPGDTVVVTPGQWNYTPFSVTASGTSGAPITIVSALGDHFTTSPPSSVQVQSLNGAALTVNGASYVDIEGFSFSSGKTVVEVTGGASHVVLDSDYILQPGTSSSAPVAVIDGGTSAITLSRSMVSSFSATPGAIVATGSAGDVITTNLVSGSPQSPGIVLSGTTGSDIVGNTIGQGCGSDVAVTAGSTGATIENNDLSGLATQAVGCPVADAAAAVLKVDASSVSGTTSDYNDVYPSYSGDSMLANYSWSGVGYSTAAAFAAATGQGVHDTNAGGAAAIDSADSSAPGELATDLSGNPRVDDPLVTNTGAGTYGYFDRGARETQDPMYITRQPTWPTKMPLATLGTFAASVGDNWAGIGIATCTYDFGDGSSPVTVTPANGVCSAQHAYSTAAGYKIRLTAKANDGASITLTSGVAASGANQLLPQVSFYRFSSRQVAVSDSGYHGWNIVRCVVSYGDGSPSDTVTDGSCGATHTYAGIGTFTVTITETDIDGNVASATGSFTASGYDFNPVPPTRVLDTRAPIGVATAVKVAPGGVVSLKLAGTNGIPADAVAVTMNVTVTDASSGGYVTVYPDGTATPNVSNLNFTAGATVPNVVVAGLGADGVVDLKNSSAGTVDLVADLEGYYAVTGDSYGVGTSSRVVDTRQTHQTLPAHGTLRVYLGFAGNMAAATLNVTVTNPTANGFVTAYPDGTAVPNASNVNFMPHQTVANEVVTEVGPGNYVDFTNSSAGTVDLVVDENGGFWPGNAGYTYTPITPTRFLDTRKAIGDFQAAGLLPSGAVPGFGTGLLKIGGETAITGVPADANAAQLNVTVTGPASGGYITAYPSEQTTRPLGSTLNFSAGQTIANAASMLMIARNSPAPDGIYLYNGSAGGVQLVVDVFGYYN